jgi:hypothetical protein
MNKSITKVTLALLGLGLISIAGCGGGIPDDLDPASRSAWVQNKRVRLDTRKWIASRVYRQVYGDRVDVSVSHNQISIAGALEAAII